MPGMIEPASAKDLFKGRHFDQEIIVLCVRWYLTFKLSSRDLVQMMAERGIALAHTTILRWVQQYVPDFEKRWKRYALPVGDSRRVDETYLKVRGQWVYLYVRWIARAARWIFSVNAAICSRKTVLCPGNAAARRPRVITLDGNAASHKRWPNSRKLARCRSACASG